jgi:hypothetical protein
MFAGIEQMGGKWVRTIRQARANVALTMLAACHSLQGLVYFQSILVRLDSLKTLGYSRCPEFVRRSGRPRKARPRPRPGLVM